MKRKALSLLLALVMTLTLLPVTARTHAAWYDEYVRFVTRNNIFDSTENGFYPNDLMTRAMIVQVLFNTDAVAKNDPEPTATYLFDDVVEALALDADYSGDGSTVTLTAPYQSARVLVLTKG